MKEGDIVAFEWNPGFEHPAEVGDLKTFRLTFGKIEDDGTIRRVGDRVTLSTLPVRGQRSLGEGSLSAPINGIYQMNFPVYLHGVPSGEYDLINTKAETSTEQGISDSTSAMTNSPLRYRFCLNVIAAAPVGRK